MHIEDKVVVVTGAGNGIGREVTLEVLRRGGRVAALDRDERGLGETAALAGGAGGRLSTHPVDITDRAAVDALPAAVVAGHGAVAALVNVAGVIHRFAPLRDLTVPEMERVMAVNYWGTVHTTRAFLPLLLERPVAALVNVSSMGALVPAPWQGAYGASKAAVKAFTEALQAELQGTAVVVTAVYPGAVRTDIVTNSGLEDLPAALQAAPTTTRPQDAGRQIVEAIEQRAARVLIGDDAHHADRLSRLDPAPAR
jgi:NAD(P)-dependent dehydrogenase (short-subunit alcohol dehydrogenase family)